MELKELTCEKCDCLLEELEINFSYLDRQFSYKVPRCPKCGQTYISEELVVGKISRLEKLLDEK